MFSTLVLAFLALLMVFAWKSYNNLAFFAAAISLSVFMVADFIPYTKFDGLTLVYHNNIVYYITFLLILAFLISNFISSGLSLALFLALLFFSMATYLLNLW